MKKFVLVIAVLAALAPFRFAHAAVIRFSIPIEAEQAVPLPNPLSQGSGVADFTLRLPENPAESPTLDYTIQLFGLDLGNLSGFPSNPQTPQTDDDVTAIHIHKAPPGQQGPAFFGIVAPNDDNEIMVDSAAGTVSGNWDDLDILVDGRNAQLLSTSIDEILAGELYLNIHTTTNPLSDIRAQIIVAVVPEPSTLGLAAIGLALAWTTTRRRRETAHLR